MERRQAHSFFRSRLRRATTLSRFDRDPSRRSTVAMVPFAAATTTWVVYPSLTAPRAHNGFWPHCLTGPNA